MILDTVIYEKHDAIAHVTLNRPKTLNAYNIQMRDDLYEVFTAVRDDPDVRAMIVSGAGKAFCAGADLTEFGTAPSPVIAREVRWGRDLWGVLKNLDKLTIVAMHGFVFGSGLELALLSDLRLASEETIFGLPETALGFIPGAGATQSLPRVIEPGTALEMILSCGRVDASEAFRVGLVNRIVSKDSLLAEAQRIAQKVLAAGPLAVSLAKEAINAGFDLTLKEGLDLETRLSELTFSTQDAWEGMRAHVEGREPVFQGK